MLRRRPDDTFEFRQVESALWSARQAPLSPERKEALRLRIMSQLGAQEEVRQTPLLLRERWIAIPAGMGIAAAIVAAVQVERATAPDTGHRVVVAHATGDLLVDGRVSAEARPGQLIEARSYSWLSLGDDVRLGLEPGSSASYQDDLGRISVRFLHGHLTVANTDSAALIVGDNWTATLAPGTAAMFRMVDGLVVVTVADGEVTIVVGDRTIHVTAGNGPALITGTPSLAPEAPRVLPPAAATPATPGHRPTANEIQQADPVSRLAPSGPAAANVPAPPPPFENTGFTPPPATKDPEHHDNAGGVAVPPGQAKTDGAPASPTPPSATPATPETAGNGGSNPNAGAGNSNSGGNGNSVAGENPNAGPGNSNAGGNGNGVAGTNPNAGPGNSNAGGNGNGVAGTNPNAGAGNSNAGGNGNGVAGTNPNAGAGNSNAGGNGNGVAGTNPNAGPGNSSAGGNGNPNKSNPKK